MRIAKRAMFRKPVCPKLKQKYFNQRHHGIGSSDRKRLAYPAPSTTGLAGHSSHGFPFICAHPKQFPLLPPPPFHPWKSPSAKSHLSCNSVCIYSLVTVHRLVLFISAVSCPSLGGEALLSIFP